MSEAETSFSQRYLAKAHLEQMKMEELQTSQRIKCVNDEGYQLQNHQMATDVENNIRVNTHPLETTVLIIQHDWRDFLQTQDILEKRSPSPPSLSSDKMSTSISMTTLSDGSTPVSPALISLLQADGVDAGVCVVRLV
ncbi:hypothetical protein cypCar_00012708 [Cyprinus carpio]|nr:hypothetical protein cypCar_00012708 [Cyprinus carpio]